MKVEYYKDTDSLYIDLSENPSGDSREITEGVVLDYDAAGNLAGIDIEFPFEAVRVEFLLQAA